MFLSGGIDSSTIAALMQANSARPIRTFSVGFREKGYDEAADAKRVAAHLGTEHTELYVTPAEARAVIPKLPQIYDEPFADPSEIPTFLLSEMTRRHVTVALSGDGGDEVFAGYNRYIQGLALAKASRRLPHAVRAGLAAAIHSVSPGTWDRLFRALPEKVRPRLAGEKMHKLAVVLPKSRADFYESLAAQGDGAEAVVLGTDKERARLDDAGPPDAFADDIAWMQYRDTKRYLPDDILTKVDRASMAVSLEVRVPFLDHRLVEFAWRLPLRFKVRGGAGKWILRQIAYKYVPSNLLERPKMGFAVPIDEWLRVPLKEWAGDLLSPQALGRGGMLDPALIARKWREHQSGERNCQYFLWNVLMFQAWNLSIKSSAATI
jgi:asparagine synthase (glutamine-hydrolysing)